MFTTKCTKLAKNVWGCRVFRDGFLLVEGRAYSKEDIGAVFRDLLRTVDKCFGSDAFTKASRKRRDKDGNKLINVKHIYS